MLFACSPGRLSDPMTDFARPVSSVPFCVLFIEFMSIFAMRLGSKAIPICPSSESKASSVVHQRWLKYFFNWHSGMKSRTDSAWINSKLLPPLRNREPLTIESEKPSIPSVVLLIFFVCPSAIARLVVAVVVDALKGAIQWARSHVGKELCEVQPAFADCDAPAAIMDERFVLRIEASGFHAMPNSILMELAMSIHILMKNTFRRSLGCEFIPKASARPDLSVFEMIGSSNGSFAALTFANPIITPSIRPTNNGHKTATYQSGNIFWKHEQFSAMCQIPSWHVMVTGDNIAI